MDSGKKNADNEEEAFEDLKQRFEDAKQKFSDGSKVFEDLPNKFKVWSESVEVLEEAKTLESFNRIITWFLAITIGTLLWVLSNFDKFNISDTSPPLMPNKEIYMLSIFLIALSSIFLIIIQCIFYLYQYEYAKAFASYQMSYLLFKTEFEDYKSNWSEIAKELNGIPNSETVKKMLLLQGQRKTLVDKTSELTDSVLSLKQSSDKVVTICRSKYVIFLPVIFYISGFISISGYILIFMYKYIK